MLASSVPSSPPFSSSPPPPLVRLLLALHGTRHHFKEDSEEDETAAGPLHLVPARGRCALVSAGIPYSGRQHMEQVCVYVCVLSAAAPEGLKSA